MDDTRALPDLHVGPAGLLLDVIAEIAVGQEQNGLVRRNGVDHLHGVARGAQNIALRLHFHRGVDVADDHVIRIAAAVFTDRLYRASLDQAATGGFVGDHHDLRWVETLAVSAINHTPQKAMTSPSRVRALRANSRLSPTTSARA